MDTFVTNRANMPDFYCVYKSEKGTVEIEYKRHADGFLEVTDIHFEPRPLTPWELRQERARRGLELTDEEEQAETLQPYTRREK